MSTSTAQPAPVPGPGNSPVTSMASGAASGAVAGVAGGLVFGASMAAFGTLTTVASIVHASSALVGFVVHMLFAVVIGAGFGVFVIRQRVRVRDTVFWGLIYGAFWWFLGQIFCRYCAAGLCRASSPPPRHCCPASSGTCATG